ncbi:hypothetical protein ACFXDJ_03915 [Streptomyces sp. NPDC059443]|uniref:hypothetical protein n=1 Tax=unclassified Streptomyces TaxID=2593676 RepID=UPI0036A4D308
MSSMQLRTRHPLLVAGVGLLAGLMAGCMGATAEQGGQNVSRSPGRQVPYWMDGVTVESVANALHVQMPSTATEAKAAYQKGFQDDGLLLSFVLPTAAVDGFLTQLKPERPLHLREQPFVGEGKATTSFSHLGLPEPDSLAGVREGVVCAPCKGDLNALEVAVARVDDNSSRVYLRGVD